MPPTAPPTIAPVFEELFTGYGLGDGTGMGVVVDTSVVTMIDPCEFVKLVDRINKKLYKRGLT
jgi:hypothetical protein